MFSLDDEYILFTREEVWIKSIKENCKTCLVKDSVNGSLYIKKEISDKSSLYIYKALKNIKHKNLSEILHVIESENGFVIIEEYIHGSSLKEKMSDSGMLSDSEPKEDVGTYLAAVDSGSDDMDYSLDDFNIPGEEVFADFPIVWDEECQGSARLDLGLDLGKYLVGVFGDIGYIGDDFTLWIGQDPAIYGD